MKTSFLKTLSLITLLLLSQGCLKSERTKSIVEDDHDLFVSLVNERISTIAAMHRSCVQWNMELQTTFQTTEPETVLRNRGQIFQLLEKDPKKKLEMIKSFDDSSITRYLEYELYRMPLDFPRTDRNLNYYLEATRSLPECHSLFDEYGFMHAMIFEAIDHPTLKTEAEKLILEYLLKSLENEHYPFINLLTNAALMRTLASVGILPKESADAFGHLLMQIESEQQRFMESIGQTLKSEGVPTLSEYRAILALNQDREEKTKFYQNRLFEFLQDHLKK